MSITISLVNMLSIKVLDAEIDKRVSVILGKNPFDVIRSKYAPTDIFVSICRRYVFTTNDFFLLIITNLSRAPAI